MAFASIITVSLNPAIDRVVEVDRFAFGAHQEARDVLRTAGGKGINVSRMLAAMGVRTIATGFLGEENRASFDSLFRDSLIRDEFFNLPGRTRENVTIADHHTGQETHLRARGLPVAPRHLARLEKKLGLLAAEGSLVIFSGSLPPEVTPEQFRELVDSCSRAGAKVAVDTSGDALRSMAGRRLWLVKPNSYELPLLVGRDLGSLDEELAAARELAGRVEYVLFTCGAAGAYLFGPDVALHARVDVGDSEICNTVGCGDVLLGAFVAGLSVEQGIHQTFRDAVACATASAMNFTPGEFDPADLFKLQPHTELVAL